MKTECMEIALRKTDGITVISANRIHHASDALAIILGPGNRNTEMLQITSKFREMLPRSFAEKPPPQKMPADIGFFKSAMRKNT